MNETCETNGISEIARSIGALADSLEIGPLTQRLRLKARQISDAIADLSDEERETIPAELFDAMNDRLFDAGYTSTPQCRGPMHGAARSLRVVAERLSPENCGVPEVLTEAEAVRVLRLDTEGGPSDPYQVLYRYRKRCLLRAVQIGRQIFYTKEELMRFLQKKTEGNF